VTKTEILPDDAALRTARRERVLAEMEAAGVDMLVLGREANARYVSGTPRLWLSGTRPVGTSCVLVRETGDVHLLTSWDEGVPDDIPRENLFGFTFNPANLVKALRALPNAATVTTVATDAMSPTAAGVLSRSFPAATLVDGEPMLRAARRLKSAAEVAEIRAAVGVAERATAAAAAALVPGASERHVTAVFMEAMAAEGIVMPSVQDAVWITSPAHPWRRTTHEAIVKTGDLVAVEAGAMLDLYAGEVGRTFVVVATRREAGARLRARIAAGRAARRCLRSTPPWLCRRCRWLAVGLGFDAPLDRRPAARPRPSGWSRAWCWPSLPLCGRRVWAPHTGRSRW
jgi:Xaa-Pro aminopeptidase